MSIRQALLACALLALAALSSAPRAHGDKKPTPAPGKWLKTTAEIRRALQSAEEIRVYNRRSTEGDALVVLSPRSHPEMFKTLKGTHRFRSGDPGMLLAATGRLLIRSAGQWYEVGYSPHAGVILGAATQSATVSDECKRWLLKRMPPR